MQPRMGSQNEQVPGGSFGEFYRYILGMGILTLKQSQGTWTVDDRLICPDEAAGHSAALHATLWLWRLWREL